MADVERNLSGSLPDPEMEAFTPRGRLPDVRARFHAPGGAVVLFDERLAHVIAFTPLPMARALVDAAYGRRVGCGAS
jgi:hypothetical protein